MPQLVRWLQFIECFEAKPHQDVDVFIDTIDSVAEMLGCREVEKKMCAQLWLRGQALRLGGQAGKVLEETILAQFFKCIRGSIQRFVPSRAPQNFQQVVQFVECKEQIEVLATKRSYSHSVVHGASQSTAGSESNYYIAQGVMFILVGTWQHTVQKKAKLNVGTAGKKTTQLRLVTFLSPQVSAPDWQGKTLDINKSIDYNNKILQDDVQLYTFTGSMLDIVSKIDVDIIIENEILRYQCIICSYEMVFNADGLLVNLSEGNLKGTAGVIMRSTDNSGICCRDGQRKASRVLGLAGSQEAGSQGDFIGDRAPIVVRKYKECEIGVAGEKQRQNALKVGGMHALKTE
ncbi:hypothetical protein PR048_013249 [Dryococelus australis]|uniref:Uncharacterized protein n=1 Tax=Dryococelus australis TaxID=614101 RepID=A0ABQ9HSG1_9NEOP|nr:hypothetical protein PR048_013249 [Dryococelus australis]